MSSFFLFLLIDILLCCLMTFWHILWVLTPCFLDFIGIGIPKLPVYL
jgi:hypothetical protein